MIRGLTVQRVVVIAFAAIAAATSGAAAESLPLHDNWAIQSSAKITAAGEAISTSGFTPDGWYPTSVPATVLAALVENKVYPDPFYGDNITKIPGYKPRLWLVMDETSPFFPTWITGFNLCARPLRYVLCEPLSFFILSPPSFQHEPC